MVYDTVTDASAATSDDFAPSAAKKAALIFHVPGIKPTSENSVTTADAAGKTSRHSARAPVTVVLEAKINTPTISASVVAPTVPFAWPMPPVEWMEVGVVTAAARRAGDALDGARLCVQSLMLRLMKALN